MAARSFSILSIPALLKDFAKTKTACVRVRDTALAPHAQQEQDMIHQHHQDILENQQYSVYPVDMTTEGGPLLLGYGLHQLFEIYQHRLTRTDEWKTVDRAMTAVWTDYYEGVENHIAATSQALNQKAPYAGDIFAAYHSLKNECLSFLGVQQQRAGYLNAQRNLYR